MTVDDRELMRAFQEEAARIAVLPRTRPRQRSASGLLAVVLTGAFAIFGALVLGRALSDIRTPTSSVATAPAEVATVGPRAFVVGTREGRVYSLGPSGLGEKVFDCQNRPVARAERSPDGRRLLVICRAANDSGEVYGEAFVVEPGSAPRALPIVLLPGEVAWSPDGRTIAVLAHGTGCMAGPPWLPRATPDAPGCRSRVTSYDIASGEGRSLGDEGLSMDNLRWTPRGLTYYRGDPGAGTFVWDGSAWRPLFADRIAAVALDGRLLLDRVATEGGRARHVAVLLADRAEAVLTPGAASERGLALDQSGRAIALLDEGNGVTAVVVYSSSATRSVTRGEFGIGAVRAGNVLASVGRGNAIAFYQLDTQRLSSLEIGETPTAIGLGPE